MRYLLAADPLTTFQPAFDTGMLLAQELLSRGIALDYLDLDSMDWRRPTSEYLASLKAREVKGVLAAAPCFDLGPERSIKAQDYAVILQRKDPPVDDAYIGHAKHFATLPDSVIQMNHPSETWRYSEHLLPTEFPEFSAPTHRCRSFEEFEKAVEKYDESVAKPIHLFSGIGIAFFKKSSPREDLLKYWEEWKPQVVLQKFLPEVQTMGDLRILAMNGKIIGSVMRRPRAGSRLANLHQGGSAHFFEPTPKQKKAVVEVCAKLCPKRLYLLGLDFIGDYLTEVNITCPSAVKQINSVMGIRGEKLIIDELERMRGLGVERK